MKWFRQVYFKLFPKQHFSAWFTKELEQQEVAKVRELLRKQARDKFIQEQNLKQRNMLFIAARNK
jgi:hypothetical protein